MAQYKHQPLMKLLDEWADEHTLQNHFSRRGPEINSNRTDWEQGVYENSLEKIEALLKLAGPAPPPSTDSGPDSEPAPKRARLLDGKPGKRPRTDRGAEPTEANEGSPLLALPNLLIIEVLNRCTADSLAAASLTCTTLERTVALGGIWKHLYLRDFSPPTHPGSAPQLPADIPPQESPADVYKDLRNLKKMGWAEWDVNPMRVQHARKEGSEEGKREYEENVPLDCWRHATVVLGDQLVLTGGKKDELSFNGTFAFDLVKKEWRKVPTKLRCRDAIGSGSHTVDWELPTRCGHTMTAINGHEDVVLFGKRTLTTAEFERLENAKAAARAAAVPVQGQWGWRAAAGMKAAKAETEAIWAEALHEGLHTDAYLVDTATWTYEKIEATGVPPAPPRKGHTAVLHPNKQGVVTLGGLLTPQRGSHPSVSSGELNLLTWVMENGKRVWAWRELEVTGEVPHAQHGHGACVVGDRMVVIGGYKDGVKPDQEFMKVWVLDFKTMQ